MLISSFIESQLTYYFNGLYQKAQKTVRCLYSALTVYLNQLCVKSTRHS